MRGQHFSVMDVFYSLVNHLYDEGSAKCIICPNSGMKNEALEKVKVYEEMVQKGKLAELAIPTELKYISHNDCIRVYS